MKEDINLKKKGNGEQPEKEAEEDVEGYKYCDSHEAKCSNDCSGSPFLSHLN